MYIKKLFGFWIDDFLISTKYTKPSLLLKMTNMYNDKILVLELRKFTKKKIHKESGYLGLNPYLPTIMYPFSPSKYNVLIHTYFG